MVCAIHRLVWALAVCAGLAFVPGTTEARGRGGFTIPSGIDRRKLDPQPDYERTMKEGAEAKGASVECTSGYRSDSQQADACRGACKGKVPAGQEAKGCPGFCAPPGRSNHQHVATCDMKGIPGSAQQGCDFLFEMCQQMRSRDRSLQCEIGGYGPGAHHLAVGRGIKPSAYNQCKHLKSKMGMDPGRDKRLQDDANKLQDEIMGNPNQQAGSPQMPQMPQPPASSPPASYPSAANSSPPASYPTPYGATAPTPGSARAGKSSGDNSKGPISIDVPRGISDPNYSDVTKGKIGDAGDPSGITGGGGSPSFQAFGGGPVVNERGGRDFSGASKPGASGSGSFGSGASSSSSSSSSSSGSKAAAASGGSSGAGASSEVLANYAGGMSSGKLGGSKANVQGSEVASAVQSLEQEFGAAGEAREPASEQEAVGAQESGSLFERMREAHTRCLRRGCVSRAR